MARRTLKRSRRGVERYLPLVYFFVAIALIVIVLPTALRPPPQQATQSAELSPDSPPDQADSLVSSFSQGSSSTAGAGDQAPTGNGLTGAAGGGNGGPGGGNLPGPPDKLASRACPAGVGNPARQTPNVYAPPCAAAFQGNNGGATWRGVTATQINIDVQGTGANNKPSANGAVTDVPKTGANAWDRTYSVFQQYFNKNFQLYGRRLQFYVSQPSGIGVDAQIAAATAADKEYNVFASGFTSEPECSYFAEHQIIAWCEQNPLPFYENSSPYLWGWYMNGTELTHFGDEYICKKLAGKPAIHAGDPLYQQTTRKFGMLLYDTRGYAELGPVAQQELKSMCNVDLEVIGANLDNQQGEASLGTAVARFKADGVTTIIPAVDYISSATFTNSANSSSWFPEWLTFGGGALDRNQLAQLQNQTEWAHAFGLTALDMERPNNNTDCYRAYHSVDPNNDPNFAFCTYVYPSLYGLISGIQLAGPVLNPTAFREGWFKMGYRFMDHPVWAIGGGFAPGDPTYTDNVTEIWWNSTAASPNGGTADGTPGAYEYVRGGQRYKLGTLPKEDSLVFRDGVTETQDTDSVDAD